VYVLDSSKLPVSSKEHSKSYVIYYLCFSFCVDFSRFVNNCVFVHWQLKNLENYMQEVFLRKLSELGFVGLKDYRIGVTR